MNAQTGLITGKYNINIANCRNHGILREQQQANMLLTISAKPMCQSINQVAHLLKHQLKQPVLNQDDLRKKNHLWLTLLETSLPREFRLEEANPSEELIRLFKTAIGQLSEKEKEQFITELIQAIR